MNGALQDVVAVDFFWGFDFDVELWRNCNRTEKERLDVWSKVKGQRSEGTHHSEPR